MPAALAVVTITTVNQMYRARLLMRQVAAQMPEAVRIIYLADTLPPQAPLFADDPLIVPVSLLAIPRARQLAFALDPTGYCCAQKPWIMLNALERTEARGILYLDNDIGLFARPCSLLGLLSRYPIVLTPHLLAPQRAPANPSEADLLPYGPFNAGQLATDNSPAAHEFLLWWGTRLLDPRNSKQETGYDQPWLGWAPLYFEVGVDRDPGCNVAFWNLSERPLRREKDGWTAGGARLATFHFSWLEENDPTSLVRRTMPATAASDPLGLELVRERLAQLEACGRARDVVHAYSHGTYSDGFPIEPRSRASLASAWHLVPHAFDPFSRESWLGEPTLVTLPGPYPLPASLHRRIARRLLRLIAK